MKKTLLHLARDTALVYGAQMIGVTVGLIVSILVARLLGPDGRGAYAWIMTMHFFALQLGMFGGETMNRRLGASRPELTSTLAGNSIVQGVVGGSLAGLLVLAFALLQPIGWTHKMATALGMIAVPAVVAMGLCSGLATARGHARIIAATEISQRFLIVGCVGAAYLALGYLTLNILMAGILVALTATSVLSIWMVSRIAPLPWHVKPRLWWNERYLLVGAFWGGMATFGLQKLDLLMLGAWRPLEESGYYAVAQALMDASLILPGTLGVLLLSRLTALETLQERRLMLVRVLGIVLAGFSLIALVAVWLGQWVIPLLFGAKFVASVPVFSVLMVAAVAGAAFWICQNAATGVGRVRYVMVAPLVGVAAKVLAGVALIPSFGMVGAAWGSALAYALAALAAFVVAWNGRGKRHSA